MKKEVKELIDLYEKYIKEGLNEKEYKRMTELVEKFSKIKEEDI